MNLRESLSNILTQGINRLGLDVGIISHVTGETYQVLVCVSDTVNIKSGDEFELSETYCTDVVREQQTKHYRDVAKITEMLKHPVYLNTQLRAYIGTPIVLNEGIWGTLNYSSLRPRKRVYSKDEIKFLESQAIAVANILERHPLELGSISRTSL